MASSVLASFDAGSLSCLSAQTFDPTKDHKTRGMVALSDNKFAFTEFVAKTAGRNPTEWDEVTRVFNYVRCEDGAIDMDTNECVCFGTGYECKEHKPVIICSSSSDSSSSSESSGKQSSAGPSSVGPSPSSVPYSSSGRPSPYSSCVSSQGSSRPLSDDSSESKVDNTNFIVSIVLIALTGAFLITAVVFIVLFIVLRK